MGYVGMTNRSYWAIAKWKRHQWLLPMDRVVQFRNDIDGNKLIDWMKKNLIASWELYPDCVRLSSKKDEMKVKLFWG